jgi:hypothetical protein
VGNVANNGALTSEATLKVLNVHNLWYQLNFNNELSQALPGTTGIVSPTVLFVFRGLLTGKKNEEHLRFRKLLFQYFIPFLVHLIYLNLTFVKCRTKAKMRQIDVKYIQNDFYSFKIADIETDIENYQVR